jgi:SAM-dependent methyltransferase
VTDWRQGPNAEQIEHWNADEAEHWVREADRYDAMLRPFGELAMDRAGVSAGERVLDVGCGGGQTTLAIAERVGARGAITGIDISEPLVRRAREAAKRAGVTNVEFELGDAQTHPFPAGAFDAVFSRFGIMFFADPEAAFANLAGALRPGGRIAFVCWREFEAQEWLVVPGAAALAYVPMPDLGEPGAPGMFAFADADRTRQVLGRAGFSDIRAEATDLPLVIAGGGSVDDVMKWLDGSPIVNTLLEDADENAARSALAAIRESFEPYATPHGVVLRAGVWVVSARKGE